VLNFILGLKTSSRELEDLNKMFLKLDTDKNGTLERDELKDQLHELIGTFDLDHEETDWDEFFDTIDTNKDGVIRHKEFIVAAFDRRKVINGANLNMAFNIIDENGDGMLTMDEIKKAFGGHHGASDETWKSFMEEADKNHDGQISREEFHDAMQVHMRNSLG